jgi:hypothetical protein
MSAELWADTEILAGLLLLGLYIGSFWPLRRLLASPARPRWLKRSLNGEYVMLGHIAVLLAALALLALGLIR